MTENGIVTIDDWEAEYQSYPTVRPEDYYDLIELPDGHHIPVPIAKRLVGERIVESIPVSRKTRGQRFFYCAPCDRLQTWITEKGVSYIGSTQNGHSFFRCKIHKPTSKEENEAKESMLVRLILGGLYRSLRYVEAER
jgi:hypothetical protein